MRRLALLSVSFASLLGSAAARADHEPVIVIPMRPGVPIMINGRDASYAVVEGDWGLARPGHGRVIIEGPVWYANRADAGPYFPSAGHAPRYGRLEVEPPRRYPRAPTDYTRSWAAGSDTTQPVTEYPPFNPPSVIAAPPEPERRRPRPRRAPSRH